MPRRRMLHRFAWLVAGLLATQAAWPAQLGIIIDDLGYNAELGRRIVDLPGDITLAILPFTPHGQELATTGYRQGKEIILHAPMSNSRDLPLGPGGLTSDMDQDEFQQALEKMLAAVPHIRGLNNHMGSQLTRETRPMTWLMAELADRGLYFVDSRTSAESQALRVAQSRRLPSVKRDLFLDNQRDITLIRQQLQKALVLAQRRGRALAIGHPYPETLTVLEELPALLATTGVRLVKVSELLPSYHAPPSACPAPPLLLWRPMTAPPAPPEPGSWMQTFGYESF